LQIEPIDGPINPIASVDYSKLGYKPKERYQISIFDSPSTEEILKLFGVDEKKFAEDDL
jgi:hypothetical protein